MKSITYETRYLFFGKLTTYLKKFYSGKNKHEEIVFVFLGEFGYELLNWQGKVRNFAKSNNHLRVSAISRKSCEILYENSTRYIPLDSIDLWKNSIADGYFARFEGVGRNSILELKKNRELHKAIKNAFYAIAGKDHLKIKWVWSDRLTILSRVEFGANRYLFGRNLEHGSIYESLEVFANDVLLTNNFKASKIQEESSPEDYILIMRAERSRIVRSEGLINASRIVEEISKTYPVILGEFLTSRLNDTTGKFNNGNFKVIQFSNLEEQFRLILKSRVCFFISEGDLRSHTYIPPLIGKNVLVYGFRDIFPADTLKRWNSSLFKETGRILPIFAEEIERNFDLFPREVLHKITTLWNSN